MLLVEKLEEAPLKLMVVLVGATPAIVEFVICKVPPEWVKFPVILKVITPILATVVPFTR